MRTPAELQSLTVEMGGPHGVLAAAPGRVASTPAEVTFRRFMVSVHRVGPLGANGGARDFQERSEALRIGTDNFTQHITLNGVDAMWDQVNLRFFNLGPADDTDWFGGRALLTNCYDTPIGSPRPLLVYGEPCDIPSLTRFSSPHHGVWVVQMRAAS